jgi:iron complex transport system substrate-binding protein
MEQFKVGGIYMKRIIVLFISILIAFNLSGCLKPAPGNTTEPEKVEKTTGMVNVTDFKGRNITLDKIPERIVSLSPSNTEILFALGAGDRVVGVTSFCDYPEEAKNVERVGSFEGPNLELVNKAQPDVVLAGYIQEDAIKMLESMGIKVIVTEAEKFENIYDSIELIGKVTGTDEKAKEIVDEMRHTIEGITEKYKDRDKPTVFYVVWTDPLTTAGSDTYINEVIKAAGGINVAEKAAGWAQYSPEALIKDNPEILVSAFHSTDRGMTKEDISKNPIFSRLEAVKKGKVHVMSDDNTVSRPGPRIVIAIREMAETFYSE